MPLADTERNKELICRWITFANAGCPAIFDQFVAADYIGHMGVVTMDRAELERLERQFGAAFPDAHHTIDDLIAEGDRVVLRPTARATHQGECEGIPRTGRVVEFTGLVVQRIAHSRGQDRQVLGSDRLSPVDSRIAEAVRSTRSIARSIAITAIARSTLPR